MQIPIEMNSGAWINVEVKVIPSDAYRFEWFITNIDAETLDDKILWADENVHDLREQINEFIYQELK